jgi:peptidoglycan/LPS O-acetylase OafA/YrhL
MAVIWLGALPAYLAADDGTTSDGTPIGSGPYALACFVGAGLLLTALYRQDLARRTVPATV